MITPRAIDAIEASDTDELLRIVDGYCSALDWGSLLELRLRCDEAVLRGKQVWGVEEHIRYRLALEAPPEIAGPVVSEGNSRFALGPLAEVAASSKTWAELSPYLAPGPERDTVAAERVVRGETVEVDVPDPSPVLEPWEPAYEMATYKRDKVETPSPALPVTTEVALPSEVVEIDDPHSTSALAALVETWTDQSNGRCQVSATEGQHLTAIAALGVPRCRVAKLDPAHAMSWMAWAAASGGAHGRRRGAAAGRHTAWWVITVLADLDWPAEPGRVGSALNDMTWHWFDDGSPNTGWVLRLAIASESLDLAWAISATDQV